MNKNSKEFIRFLKDNNVYYVFLYNVKEDTSNTIETYINFLTYEKYYTTITNAFSWSESKEGLEFWSNINRKWKQTIKLKHSEQFIQFLKENNIYDTFISNLINLTNREIKEYINNNKSNDYLINAFNWNHTIQQDDFWDNLNRKWKQIIKL